MTSRSAILAAALGCLVSAAAPAGVAENGTSAPIFTAIQPELFNKPGSLANAWGDFDGDGDLDFAISMKTGEVRLYRNDGGTFASVGAAMGLPVSGPEMRGLSWGDYNGDGWIDLLTGPTSPDAVTHVLRNNGGNGFRNVALEIGLTIPGRSARQTNWIDYDNDGDLDVYATDRQGKNRLLRNEGEWFVPVFEESGPFDPRPTVGACWLDYDGDGRLDLFLANQSGAADALWRNAGDGFADIAPQLGIDRRGRTKDEGGVGCAIGDFDNDGHLDIFVASYGRNTLYRNNGDGSFADLAHKLGLDAENHAVGAAWGDYDNDGYLDLFVTSYEGGSGQQVPANRLFRNLGGKRFVNMLPHDHPMNAGDHGVEWIDYDRDGALDLSLTDGYGPEGGHPLFHNELPVKQARRSLNVLVLDTKGRVPPGAEVRLYDRSGKVIATRQISTGGGYNSQSAGPIHFGLKSMDRLSVAVTFLTRVGRKEQWVKDIRPSDYGGKPLIVRQSL